MAVHDSTNSDGGRELSSQPLIKKLTTEKVVREQNRQAAVDGRKIPSESLSPADIINIKLSARGIKSIESLDLPFLRRLDLSKNTLNRLKGLQGCPQVTYLTVAGNELTGEGLDGVRPLRDLKVFNVSGNRVKRIAPAVFAQFRELQALVINNNEIMEVPPSWFKTGLLTLNTLVLSHNQIKSLANSGLGRLTHLTKLSVSHNMLTELPDLSACSALGELRAAHNRISGVPATLSKNTALRILDIGHNAIQDWSGLEDVGRTLTALVQLTLAGNPVCLKGDGKKTADVDADADDGDYILRVRSLFPSLKVRDGKRVRMKKSHVYYEKRARAERESAQATGEADDLEGLGTEGMDGDREKRRKPKTAGDEENPANTIRGDDEDVARAKGVSAKKRKRQGVDDESGQERREARGVKGKSNARSSADDKIDVTTKTQKKKKKEKREQGTSTENTAQSPAVEDLDKILAEDDDAVGAGNGESHLAASDGAKTRKRKKHKMTPSGGIRPETSAVDPRSTLKKALPAGGTDRGDPYSSSEELPSAKAPSTIVDRGQKVGVVGGAEASGVVSVVITSKGKRVLKETSRSKVSKRKKASERVRGEGEDGDEQRQTSRSGFSLEAMLDARGERETIGLGGASAWE